MSKYNYYTPIELAALLLELIPQKASISSAIDICCGSWNLLAAAKRHYPEVKITGVDITRIKESAPYLFKEISQKVEGTGAVKERRKKSDRQFIESAMRAAGIRK